MGGGKTSATLTTYLDLAQSFDARRVLVFAPLRVARKVWSDEVKKWSHLGGITVSKAVGTAAQRWDALKAPADVHTINTENTRWLEAQFIQNGKQVRRFPWDMIVLDESTRYKSRSTNAWKSMRKLRRLCSRMVQLTGTPASNGYKDLWAQIYLLDKGQRLGATESAFQDRWFFPDTSAQYPSWHLKDGADKQIQAAVADIVLSLPDEQPPAPNNYIRVALSDSVRKLYRKLARQYLIEHGGNTINAVNAATLVGKLAQLANGAVYHDGDGNWTHIHDAKLDALIETLDSVNGPAIIVYGFRHDKARLSAALEKFCGKHKRWAVLDSEQSEDDWNAGKTDFLLLHPASAGHGLNLQGSGSETIIWFGLTNNREHYDQANARLIGGHRRGNRNVVIHHIVADGTIDDDLVALLRDKGKLEYGLKTALAKLSATI